MIEYLEMSNAMTLKLDQIQLQVEQLLKSFVQKGGLSQKILAPAFGVDLDREKLSSLAQQFARGDISSWPKIEIRDGAELGGARGAYALEKDKIYLARKFIEQAPFQEIVEVLLEEIGHGVDAQVNTKDSAGDEGAIFSALVRGKDLTKAELAALQQEDDTVTLTIDGQILRAEAATLTVNTLNNVTNNSDV